MNNLCLGWFCDLREACAKYIPNVQMKPGQITYFLPLNVGEHCEYFRRVAGDGREI